MKKVIIGLSALVIMVLAVVLVVNAQDGNKTSKKSTTEVSANCKACPSASTCTSMKENKTSEACKGMSGEAKCDSTKTKMANCDMSKSASCCTKGKTETTGTTEASCATKCPMKSETQTK